MNDALGNEIVLGQSYGYSAKDTVFLGVAEKFTKTRVTLRTVKRGLFSYGEEGAELLRIFPPAASVSVSSFHLFPIPNLEAL